MSEDEHEIDGLIVDDDPALDYILYEKMLEENKKIKVAVVAWLYSYCF